MLDQIRSVYGLEIHIFGERQPEGLPVYMISGRKIYEAQCMEQSFLLVGLEDEGRFGSAALEKQLAAYQTATGMFAAFLFDKMTGPQRAALIKRQIPFISEPDQVYLPFLGLLLKGTLKKGASVPLEKMMPATQSLFLYLMHGGQQGCLKKDAADALHLTRTSITRASEQLANMGLIREERSGKEIRMYAQEQGKALFEQAQPYLINPVQEMVFIHKADVPQQAYYSGVSALAKKTMLNESDIPVFAVDKNLFKTESIHCVDPLWEPDDAAAVELWKYDPGLFAIDGVVDPISLAMTFAGNEDERIEEALDEYMEDWKW